jgi:uncharacterized membrane protein
MEGHVWGRMGRGLLVLIPLIVTLLILRIVVVSVDDIFRGDGGFFSRWIDDTPLNFPGVGLVFLVLVLYGVGLVVSAGRVGRTIVRMEDAVLSRIPIVKNIYGVVRQITDTLASPMGHRFSRVVFIEWPRQGYMALGFVTGHCHSPSGEGTTLLVVYIPTVPNPTSGNMAFVSEDDIIETDMTVEEAMKLVFSGGIVLPEMLKMNAGTALSEPPPAGQPSLTED